MAEKIHEKLLQTCGHENCSVRKVNIKEHEAGCEMALVKCSYCQTNVTIRGLGLHEDIECEHRRFKCPNSGCPLEMVAKESQDHKQQCEYRHIQCLICQERVPMKLLFSHIMNIHTSGYFDGSKVVCKQKLQIDKAFKKQFLMKAYQHSFLALMELKNNLFSCYISILGSVQDAAKFNVNVVAYHPDQKNMKMEGQGPVDAIESGKTMPILFMDIEQLKKMRDNEGRNCFRFKVQYDSKEDRPSKLKNMIRSLRTSRHLVSVPRSQPETTIQASANKSASVQNPIGIFIPRNQPETPLYINIPDQNHQPSVPRNQPETSLYINVPDQNHQPPSVPQNSDQESSDDEIYQNMLFDPRNSPQHC